MKSIQSQFLILKKSHTEFKVSVKVSYIIAQKIATKSKPSTDIKFIKECMETAHVMPNPKTTIF